MASLDLTAMLQGKWHYSLVKISKLGAEGSSVYQMLAH